MPQSRAFLITVLVLNLVTDLCIILIPIPIILPLNISMRRKLGIMLLFCAGVFTMMTAVLRVYFVLVVGNPRFNSACGLSLTHHKASKGRYSRYLVVPRRCRRHPHRPGYHNPTSFQPPILER
jgi:hypothetical protein